MGGCPPSGLRLRGHGPLVGRHGGVADGDAAERTDVDVACGEFAQTGVDLRRTGFVGHETTQSGLKIGVKGVAAAKFSHVTVEVEEDGVTVSVKLLHRDSI